ncbi:hypothetical protein BG003_001085, partial [Podila horticola]
MLYKRLCVSRAMELEHDENTPRDITLGIIKNVTKFLKRTFSAVPGVADAEHQDGALVLETIVHSIHTYISDKDDTVDQMRRMVEDAHTDTRRAVSQRDEARDEARQATTALQRHLDDCMAGTNESFLNEARMAMDAASYAGAGIGDDMERVMELEDELETCEGKLREAEREIMEKNDEIQGWKLALAEKEIEQAQTQKALTATEQQSRQSLGYLEEETRDTKLAVAQLQEALHATEVDAQKRALSAIREAQYYANELDRYKVIVKELEEKLSVLQSQLQDSQAS